MDHFNLITDNYQTLRLVLPLRMGKRKILCNDRTVYLGLVSENLRKLPFLFCL